MTDKMGENQSIDWSALIARHPLFDSLDAEEKEFLLSDKASRKHVLKAGVVILKQNETGNSVFIICEGAVSVTLEGPDGKSIELYTLTDGEVFGEMAILGQRLRTATLVTTQPCKLLEIGGDEFLVLMKKHHEITLYLLAILSQRLRHTDDMILTRHIPEIDSSLAELKGRLEVVTKTTDAKLTAAQTMFDQTNTRANEIIDSADRARDQIKWAAGIAGALVTVTLGAGYFNFERAQRAIENVQTKVEGVQTDVEKVQKDVNNDAGTIAELVANAQTAAEAAKNSSDAARDSASTAKDAKKAAEDTAAELEAIRSKALAAYNGVILTRFMARIAEDSFPDATNDDYFECINADLPEIRERLVDFLHNEIIDNQHNEIIDNQKNEAILGMLKKSLTKHESEMPPDAQVATYYFIALISILQDKLEQSARYESKIEEKSGVGRNYFDDIFGIGRFDRSEFISIATDADEKTPDLQQRKQDALERLYATLRQST